MIILASRLNTNTTTSLMDDLKQSAKLINDLEGMLYCTIRRCREGTQPVIT